MLCDIQHLVSKALVEICTMKPKQSMMGALHGFLAGAADAAPRLEARAHLGPSGAQHEPVQPTERAWGGRSRVASPGRIVCAPQAHFQENLAATLTKEHFA